MPRRVTTKSTQKEHVSEVRLPTHGFTVLEAMVTLVIISVLAGLSLNGFRTLMGAFTQRNTVGDFVSALAAGRLRAVANQRNVLFIIDASASGGYYELDDLSNAFGDSTSLAQAASSFSPSVTAVNYNLPGSPSVQMVWQGSTVDTPFVASAAAWASAFPFPFQGLSRDTTAGCTFCTSNRGALAFRPDGRAVFSIPTNLGGAVILTQSAAKNAAAVGAIVRRAILISITGHVEAVTQ